MDLITNELRQVIKVGLIKKYWDDLGLTIPTPPSLPAMPTLPPIPSLQVLEDAIQKLSEDITSNDLYTKEYQEAWKDWNRRVEAINEKYKEDIEKDTITESYYEELQQARIDSKVDEVKKFNKLVGKDKEKGKEEARKITQGRKNKEMAKELKALTELLLKQQSDWLKKELKKYEKLYHDTIKFYKDTVQLIKDSKEAITKYFTEDDGKEMVDRECDKINRLFTNVEDSMTELSVDMSSMISKIPSPDTLVAGAATGMPNPGLKIQVFMEDFKKVMTDITKVVNYMKEIIAIAKTIGCAIAELVPAFKKMMDLVSKNQDDADKNFKQAVKEARKRQRWYLSPLLAPDEKKLAGLLYPDLEVDYTNYEIKVKGYRCYCKKENVKVEIEDEESGNIIKRTSSWKDGYVRDGGERVDNKGRRYYYLTEDDLMGMMEGEDEAALLKELEQEGEYFDTDYYDVSTGTSKLSLSDGRTVLIDYMAQVGDTIRLNDGTVIVVK